MKRLTILATILGLSMIIAGIASAATVKVTPLSLNGWTIMPDGTVAVGFPIGPSSAGVGSLQFGPISGVNPANKFIMASPYNGLVSDLTSFSYDFYVSPASLAGYQHFYVNVYVDSAANGIGTTASFYDCRYDAVPSSGAPGVWTTFGFTQTSTWANVASPLAGCPTTLAGLPAGSRVQFVVLNGGQSNASDAGLAGGYDRVVVTTTGGSTTYDFEPDKDACKGGGWTALVRQDGSSFKNQGDCIQYINTGK